MIVLAKLSLIDFITQLQLDSIWLSRSRYAELYLQDIELRNASKIRGTHMYLATNLGKPGLRYSNVALRLATPTSTTWL